MLGAIMVFKNKNISLVRLHVFGVYDMNGTNLVGFLYIAWRLCHCR